LRAYFAAHASADVEPDTLLDLVGPNYRSRISELRAGQGNAEAMRIENRTRSRTDDDGTVHRLSGAYCYLPFPALGRDATVPTPPHGNRLLFDVHKRG
jgi:uncharacterized protein (DUF1810 family)